MKKQVFFSGITKNDTNETLKEKVGGLFDAAGFAESIAAKDLVAVRALPPAENKTNRLMRISYQVLRLARGHYIITGLMIEAWSAARQGMVLPKSPLVSNVATLAAVPARNHYQARSRRTALTAGKCRGYTIEKPARPAGTKFASSTSGHSPKFQNLAETRK